jgi:F0F1-type ATP synthase membrane subunit a
MRLLFLHFPSGVSLTLSLSHSHSHTLGLALVVVVIVIVVLVGVGHQGVGFLVSTVVGSCVERR